MSAIDRVDAAARSPASQRFALMATRVAMGGLLFWWGLVKGLDTGVGQAVSDGFYGGLFSVGALLIAFGWVQVAAGVLIALGLLRRVTLPFQLVVNLFVALSVWQAFVDPFWLYLPGEKPTPFWQLFYPSLIIAAVSWLLIAFRGADAWALDNAIGGRSAAAV
ncbi:MAG: hypothetical protein ACFBWO_09790 [Paracoccaceae bacterium]